LDVIIQDHELKEIKDGASLISPCRVSSPSSSRYY